MTPKDTIDLIAAVNSMKGGNNSNDNVQLITALIAALKPQPDSTANELVKALIPKLVGGNEEKTGIKETIGVIRDVADFVGAGHSASTDTDVKIAALNADMQLRHMQMTLDAKAKAAEIQLESDKNQNLLQLISVAASVGLPAIGSAVQQLTGKMGAAGPQAVPQPAIIGQQHPTEGASPQATAPPPTPTPQATQKPAVAYDNTIPRFVTAQCPTCKKIAKIRCGPDGSYPRQVICPSCQTELNLGDASQGETTPSEE